MDEVKRRERRQEAQRILALCQREEAKRKPSIVLTFRDWKAAKAWTPPGLHLCKWKDRDVVLFDLCEIMGALRFIIDMTSS